eukprot:g28701.t1
MKRAAIFALLPLLGQATLAPDDECDAQTESCALSALQRVARRHSNCEVSVTAQSKSYLHEWCNHATVEQRFPSCYPQGVRESHPMGNIIVQFPAMAECPVARSPSWSIAGWDWSYVQLAPNASFEERMFVKLLTGSLLDVNVNGVLRDDGRWETPARRWAAGRTFVVTPPITERSLELNNALKALSAGGTGATFAFMKVPMKLMSLGEISIRSAKGSITSMSTGVVTEIRGPLAELLTWKPFADNYEADGANIFTGVEFWNLAGMLLRDSSGSHIAYVQWWTNREDFMADGGYHNAHAHSFANTTFGELHMTMYAAAPNNGMIVQLPHTINVNTKPNPKKLHPTSELPFGKEYFFNQRDNNYVQLTLPLPPGYIHGPLWSINKTTGEPTYDCQGAVRYAWHGLALGPIGPHQAYSKPLRYTMWVAFEHPVPYIKVPTPMLQYVTNAYLEYDINWEPTWCGGPEHGEPVVANFHPGPDE